MSPLRLAIIFLIALFVLPIVMGIASGMAAMMWGGTWMMSRMLFPILFVAAFVYLLRPRHSWRERRHAWEPARSLPTGEPEEVLRQRFARGELSREQYQESLIDVLKGRYVTGDLTLEEYEARVATLIADSPLRRVEGDKSRHYL